MQHWHFLKSTCNITTPIKGLAVGPFPGFYAILFWCGWLGTGVFYIYMHMYVPNVVSNMNKNQGVGLMSELNMFLMLTTCIKIDPFPETNNDNNLLLPSFFFIVCLIVCFTSYIVFRIAVFPHCPGVVYYHLLLRRETRIPGVAPFSFRIGIWDLFVHRGQKSYTPTAFGKLWTTPGVRCMKHASL